MWDDQEEEDYGEWDSYYASMEEFVYEPERTLDQLFEARPRPRLELPLEWVYGHD